MSDLLEVPFFLGTFLILLGPLMLVHELGHYWAARRAGIRVEEFGIGIPPRAVRLFKRGETEFTLNWLPFGAFVRMTGEGVSDDMNDPRSFAAASRGWRFITILAGPVMNFIAAFAILFAAYLFVASKPVQFALRIGEVIADSPAQKMGLRPGDLVLTANGTDITLSEQQRTDFDNSRTTPLMPAVRASIGNDLTLTVQRREGMGSNVVTLKGPIPRDGNPEAPLGVRLGLQALRTQRLNLGIGEAAARTATDLGNAMLGIPRVIYGVFAGEIPLAMARPVSPLGVTQIGMEIAREIPQVGPFEFIRFAALLSLLIGLSNLFPIPALDGGRLMFIVIEWLRGRRVDPTREQWVHAAGMAFLLGTFFIILAMDIFNPIVGR